MKTLGVLKGVASGDVVVTHHAPACESVCLQLAQSGVVLDISQGQAHGLMCVLAEHFGVAVVPPQKGVPTIDEAEKSLGKVCLSPAIDDSQIARLERAVQDLCNRVAKLEGE